MLEHYVSCHCHGRLLWGYDFNDFVLIIKYVYKQKAQLTFKNNKCVNYIFQLFTP